MSCSDSNNQIFQSKFDALEKGAKSHRQEMEQINKTIHPFDTQDIWNTSDSVEKGLRYCFKAIHDIGLQARIQIEVKKAEKILHQIPLIALSVQGWINQMQDVLNKWTKQQIINESEQEWLAKFAIPYAYWKAQLDRTQPKAKNKNLRQYYKDRVHCSKGRYETSFLANELTVKRKENLFLLAQQLARTFQRASSQTEGRNGYLVFINHAHKGFPKNRLQVLTVIHNYDIKRADGTTPAHRLFRREFPDLFEFICENVAGFKEPRSRKS